MCDLIKEKIFDYDNYFLLDYNYTVTSEIYNELKRNLFEKLNDSDNKIIYKIRNDITIKNYQSKFNYNDLKNIYEVLYKIFICFIQTIYININIDKKSLKNIIAYKNMIKQINENKIKKNNKIIKEIEDKNKKINEEINENKNKKINEKLITQINENIKEIKNIIKNTLYIKYIYNLITYNYLIFSNLLKNEKEKKISKVFLIYYLYVISNYKSYLFKPSDFNIDFNINNYTECIDKLRKIYNSLNIVDPLVQKDNYINAMTEMKYKTTKYDEQPSSSNVNLNKLAEEQRAVKYGQKEKDKFAEEIYEPIKTEKDSLLQGSLRNRRWAMNPDTKKDQEGGIVFNLVNKFYEY